jgi:hypothetical protein
MASYIARILSGLPSRHAFIRQVQVHLSVGPIYSDLRAIASVERERNSEYASCSDNDAATRFPRYFANECENVIMLCSLGNAMRTLGYVSRKFSFVNWKFGR